MTKKEPETNYTWANRTRRWEKKQSRRRTRHGAKHLVREALKG